MSGRKSMPLSINDTSVAAVETVDIKICWPNELPDVTWAPLNPKLKLYVEVVHPLVH
jgi:hypothetical protein